MWAGVETYCSDSSGEKDIHNITIVMPYDNSLAKKSHHNVVPIPSVIREQNYRLEVILLSLRGGGIPSLQFSDVKKDKMCSQNAETLYVLNSDTYVQHISAVVHATD